MFNKHQGLTAREWYHAYKAAAKGRDRVDNDMIAVAESVEVLKANLALEKRRRLSLHDSLVTSRQETRCSREEVTELKQSTFFYSGNTAKGWCEEYRGLDKRYLEKKKLVEHWHTLYDDAAKETERQDKVTKELREEIKNSVPSHHLVGIRDERDLAETRLGKSEAALLLEKMKYGAKCLEATDWKSATTLNGRTIEEWKKECGVLVSRAIWKEADLIQTRVALKEANFKLCDWELVKLRYDGLTAKEWHDHWMSLKNKDVDHVFSRLVGPGPTGSACKVCGLRLDDFKKAYSTCPGPRVHTFVEYVCTGCGQKYVDAGGTNCPGAGTQIIFNQL